MLKDSAKEAPICETLIITRYFVPIMPSLFPKDKRELIDKILVELHAHNFFAITFGPKNPDDLAPEDQEKHKLLAQKMSQNIEGILAKDDLSDKYRKQMEYKQQQ